MNSKSTKIGLPSQIWAGICQELAIFKKQPKYFFAFYLSVFISIALAIASGKSSLPSLIHY